MKHDWEDVLIVIIHAALAIAFVVGFAQLTSLAMFYASHGGG